MGGQSFVLKRKVAGPNFDHPSLSTHLDSFECIGDAESHKRWLDAPTTTCIAFITMWGYQVIKNGTIYLPLYFFAIFGARNSHTHQSLASVGHWKSKFVRSPTTFLLTAMAENEAMRRNRWLKILKKAVRFALPDCNALLGLIGSVSCSHVLCSPNPNPKP